MRKFAGLAIALLVMSQPALAQMDNSAHDFTAQYFAIDSITDPAAPDTTFNEFWFWPSYARYGICSSCHTAHNAFSTDAPLWNHETTAATFTLYQSPSLDNNITQPQGVSKTCLSCHDGTVAVNSLHDGHGGFNLQTNGYITGAKYITGYAGDLGTDLSDDHPISVEYDPAADLGFANLRDPSIVTGYGLVLYGTGTPTVECGSCHDPHIPGSNGLFFRVLNGWTGKSRCQICHDK